MSSDLTQDTQFCNTRSFKKSRRFRESRHIRSSGTSKGLKSDLAEVFFLLTERLKQSKSLYNLSSKFLSPIKLNTSHPKISAISRDQSAIPTPKKLPSSAFTNPTQLSTSFPVSKKYVLIKRARVVT